MYDFFITFGQGHVHRVKGIRLDHNTVAKIKVNSKQEGEIKTRRLFGTKYCWTYFHEEFNPKDIIYYPDGIKNI